MENTFRTPVKEVSSMMDMKKWENSEAYHEYVGFVLAMNEAVKGKKISDVTITSNTVKKMIELLETLDKWIDEIPPIEQPQRFGNKAFRTFYSKLKDEAESLLKLVLPEELHPAIVEVAVYLIESFGNSTRIDYGTGHEMFFAMVLYCLFKIEAFKKEDADQVILKIFDRYISLMRKLQVTYRMEPAGSHGVWSLDDYQFLPFIWGSSQLIGHPRLEPRSFPEEDIAASFDKDYMFMGCIKFIHQFHSRLAYFGECFLAHHKSSGVSAHIQRIFGEPVVKTGPFSEHSNQLWNISGVPLWEKVNSGLIKMYKKEVLGKFPVIQHVLFGSILPIKKHEPPSSVGP